MAMSRASGVLLHPTSLPGPYGIGDLGPAAEAFIDFLHTAGQRLWQVLPLGPTSYGDSPYAALSAFAGNPLLLSPDRLAEDGLLTAADLQPPPFPVHEVDFGWVISWKQGLLETAVDRFRSAASTALRQAFEAFCVAPEQTFWLEDYCLFMALKEAHDGRVWQTWPAEYAQRDPAALTQSKVRLADRIGFHRIGQFLFARQWQALREQAAACDITIIGDIPIFVAYDSAEVWARPELFELDAAGAPVAVAGVPPDYFSATGQLWGNPLYDWPAMAADGFAWWIERFRATLRLVDAVRLDHFRGFHAFWRVPAGEQTAVNGRWVIAPGADLFQAVEAELGGLPILAEDLGVITRGVEELRARFGFPGMKVLQFAFGAGADGGFQPHRYPANAVVYTGTHDNDTTVGWWTALGREERDRVVGYLGYEPAEINWALIRLASASVADTALFPLQDVLGLGSEARMNTPGRPAGNWAWRLAPGVDLTGAAARLAELTKLYQRDGLPPTELLDEAELNQPKPAKKRGQADE